MKVVAYQRVSTDKQADTGNGLEAQAEAIAQAIAARGWDLVASLTDEGRSGSSMNRPALTDALDRLDRGEADVLVVAKLDRLSRSVRDFADLVERAKRHSWSLVALDIDVDTSTPTGELMANIYGSVAQWERRIIGQRTSEAMQAMKARGVRLGRPVQLADTVRLRIATERSGGRSLRAIADDLNAEAVQTARGGKWYASTVRAVVDSLALDDLARSA
jgi:DNA invertase Pin-like site-specific DNA recombinase